MRSSSGGSRCSNRNSIRERLWEDTTSSNSTRRIVVLQNRAWNLHRSRCWRQNMSRVLKCMQMVDPNSWGIRNLNWNNWMC